MQRMRIIAVTEEVEIGVNSCKSILAPAPIEVLYHFTHGNFCGRMTLTSVVVT